MISQILSPILYFLTGFFMKLSDDQLDESSNKKLAIILGIITGIVAGLLIAINSDAAYILIAIIIGNSIAFKIDGIHHIITTISFIIVSFLTITTLTIFTPPLIPANYLSNFSIITLFLCTLCAFLDDWGHDNPIFVKNKVTKLFFEHRFAMKLIILILAIVPFIDFYIGVNITYVPFLSFSTFIYFILFEIAYFLGGKLFNRFNNDDSNNSDSNGMDYSFFDINREIMILVYITTSSKEESEKIARILLEKRLVACCNIVEKINSMYWGDGEILNDSESLIISKTLKKKFYDVKSTVKDIHSYDIPCVIAIPIIESYGNYKNWIEEELAN